MCLRCSLTASIVLFGSLLCEPEAQEGSSPFEVSEQKTHTELVQSPEHDYTITLGGTVDMDNTTTRGYPLYDVAFQPNISL